MRPDCPRGNGKVLRRSTATRGVPIVLVAALPRRHASARGTQIQLQLGRRKDSREQEQARSRSRSRSRMPGAATQATTDVVMLSLPTTRTRGLEARSRPRFSTITCPTAEDRPQWFMPQKRRRLLEVDPERSPSGGLEGRTQ